MRVVADGAGCCGIKHIRDFHGKPRQSFHVEIHEGHDEDQDSSRPTMHSWCNVTEKDFPTRKTSFGEYFKFLVNQIKERRPQGMIVLNLSADCNEDYCCEDCDGDYEDWMAEHRGSRTFDTDFVDAWRPLFKEKGFEEVTFINSNSNAQIHHFYLTYGD